MWNSRLQTEIALSTMESEYVALSALMRELMPMRTIMSETVQSGPTAGLDIKSMTANTSTFKSETKDSTELTFIEESVDGSLIPSVVHEDNAGCVALANSENMRPRTKHLSVKWHHFRDQVRNKKTIAQKIATDLNWADMLTKPLVKVTFEKIRKMLMGLVISTLRRFS